MVFLHLNIRDDQSVLTFEGDTHVSFYQQGGEQYRNIGLCVVVTSGLKQRWQMGQGSGRRGEQKTGSSHSIICLSLSLYFALCFLEIFFSLSVLLISSSPSLTHTPTQYQSFAIPELMPSRATVAINKLKCVQCLAWPEALDRHTHTSHNQYSNP